MVGGGIIGLMCAHYLRRAGADVTILERDGVGRGCSWGNLGWVCPSISSPLPAPGLGVRSVASMLDSDSPLYIKPSAMPGLSPWLLRFRSHCNEADFASGSRALTELSRSTMHLYDELAADGLEFESASAGLTFVSLRREALEAERRVIEVVGAARVEEWSADELASREPALPRTFAGALHVRTDRHVLASSVCAAVADASARDGVRVEEGFRVDAIRVIESGVVLEGPAGAVEASAVIVAAGAETGGLLSGPGPHLPLQAGKGYSLTVHDPAIRIRSPLYLCDGKIGMTPYEGSLRIGGTMELSGINRTLERRRLDSIRRVVKGVVPEALNGTRVEEWVGMRPLTPDGLPAIGSWGSVPGVFVATGHQMLGVTLAPSTGKALAQLVLEGRSEIDLAPFDPARFERRDS